MADMKFTPNRMYDLVDILDSDDYESIMLRIVPEFSYWDKNKGTQYNLGIYLSTPALLQNNMWWTFGVPSFGEGPVVLMDKCLIDKILLISPRTHPGKTLLTIDATFHASQSQSSFTIPCIYDGKLYTLVFRPYKSFPVMEESFLRLVCTGTTMAVN